ncbi:MAG: DUF1566 domain-containing protein [Planctomycetes bacterium]|nr:DUF1566 domain-containing protein [Planctomycetota bacterium]
MSPRFRQVTSWSAVGLSATAASFWAFWGIIENFHEGWYYTSLWMNLGMMLVQYLLPMILFVAAALAAIRWPRVRGGIHVVAALAAIWFFSGASPAVLYPYIVGPLVCMGIAYWLGPAQPRRWAVAMVVGLPFITLLVCGVEPAYRVSGRLDDGDRSTRRSTGNGVDLIWASEGPGWPSDGVTWQEANRLCRHLTEDGMSLAETPQDMWRLTTVDEAVRSIHRHGRNSGGSWNAASARASYHLTPDKESPFWDIRSKVIYW